MTYTPALRQVMSRQSSVPKSMEKIHSLFVADFDSFSLFAVSHRGPANPLGHVQTPDNGLQTPSFKQP